MLAPVHFSQDADALSLGTKPWKVQGRNVEGKSVSTSNYHLDGPVPNLDQSVSGKCSKNSSTKFRGCGPQGFKVSKDSAGTPVGGNVFHNGVVKKIANKGTVQWQDVSRLLQNGCLVRGHPKMNPSPS